MEELRKELLEYAIKMRERGDTYRSILNYLNSKTVDETLIHAIISAVDRLEKEKKIKTQTSNKEKLPSMNSLLGGCFLISGLVLMIFLWDEGFISTVPFILIGIGVMALTGILK